MKNKRAPILTVPSKWKPVRAALRYSFSENIQQKIAHSTTGTASFSTEEMTIVTVK